MGLNGLILPPAPHRHDAGRAQLLADTEEVIPERASGWLWPELGKTRTIREAGQ